MSATINQSASSTPDKNAILRDKRAQGIAAMGLVKREGDRFQVTTPSLRGRRTSYEVRRDENGKIRCSCLEYEEQSADNPTFRCEHILAVKHALAAKNSEATPAPPLPQPQQSAATAAAETKSVTENVAAETTTSVAVTPDAAHTITTTPPQREAAIEHETNNASENFAPVEKRAAKRLAAVPDRREFGREQNSSPAGDAEAVHPAASAPITLPAIHNTPKEHTMKTQQQEIELSLTDENFDLETERGSNAPAPTAAAPLAFPSVLRSLRQPIDPKLVKTREGWKDRAGNTHMVEYVEWHTVADLLDRVTPTWSHSVRNVVQIGEMVAVTAAITIDGVTREGIGTGAADNETGIKKAEHDALKRAAIKFGIARELYQRESEVIEKQGAAPQAGEFPRDPLAKSMSDLVTPKQLGMIRALGREANVDIEEECQAALRCRTEELSKRAASSFIDHLKNLTQQNNDSVADMRRAS